MTRLRGFMAVAAGLVPVAAPAQYPGAPGLPGVGGYSGMLGGTVDAEDDWHMVRVDGRSRIGVQLAPDHVRPDWPDGTPQQIHLDLWVEDPEDAHEHTMGLGAVVLQDVVREDDASFRVYADPAGHPFCLCWVNRRS